MNDTNKDIFDLMKKAVKGASERGYEEIRTVSTLPKFGDSGVLYTIEGSNGSNFYIWNGVEFELYMSNVKAPSTTAQSVEETDKTEEEDTKEAPAPTE